VALIDPLEIVYKTTSVNVSTSNVATTNTEVLFNSGSESSPRSLSLEYKTIREKGCQVLLHLSVNFK
jgi:hypothetical protein